VDARGRKNEINNKIINNNNPPIVYTITITITIGQRPIRESVSYGPERVHFYIGDFGY